MLGPYYNGLKNELDLKWANASILVFYCKWIVYITSEQEQNTMSMFSTFLHFLPNKRKVGKSTNSTSRRSLTWEAHGCAYVYVVSFLPAFSVFQSHEVFTRHFEVFVFYIAVVPCFYNILIWLNTEWNYLWVTEANHMIDIHSFTPHTDDERSYMPCVQFGTRQRRLAVQLKRLTVKEATQNTNYHEHKISPLHKSRKSNQR